MKRVGLALLISLCFIASYFIGSAMLSAFVFPESDRALEILATPPGLPLIVYDYFFTFTVEDEDSVLIGIVLPLVVDVVIIAVPIYGVLTLFAPLRRRSKTIESTDPPPPPPPSFDG